MDPEMLTECGDGPVTSFQYDNTNEVLDPDDVQMFVLHSGSGAAIGDPVFAVTANATEQDRKNCFAAGMNDFVTKPINSQTLAAAIHKFLPSED